MTTTTSPTVEAALMHLMATRHPLSPGDRTFIIHHAELVRDGVPLNDRQRAAAYLVLARYDDGLADIGGYDGIEVPAGVPGRPAPTDRRESAPEHTAAVRIDVRDKRIHVRTPYALKDLVKSIPSARWDPRSKTWTYPASPQAADNITSAFDAEGVRYAFEDGFGALLAEQARRIEARSLKAADDLPLPELCKTIPWRHQLQGYHFGSSIPAVMLAMDMGEQPDHALVLTPDGWSKFGDVGVGDQVIGGDGRPVDVVEVKPTVLRERWVVVADDGARVPCSPNHLWTVSGQNVGPVTLPLAVIAATLDGPRHRRLDRLPPFVPVDGPDVPVPLDPYVLGVLIAEGALSGERLRFRCDSETMVDEVRRRGYAVTTDPDGRYRWITGERPSSLLAELDLTGATSHTKRIPPVYLETSASQRLDLLRGLMDGDGAANPSPYYSTVSPHLAADVSTLVRSLGGTGRVSGPYGQRDEYRVSMGLPPGVDPFLASHKSWTASRRTHRRIVAVERTGIVEPMHCIRVANDDGLYVTDEFVVTHNTGKSKVTVDLICNSPAQSVLILCPSSVVDVWPREFRTHGSRPFEVVPMGGVDSQMKIVDRVERIKELIAAGRPFVVVSNYEALAHEPFKSFVADVKRHWGFLVLDESHRIKAPGGTWSKTCATIRKRSDRAAALSGTPLGQSPLDAFAQFRALDPTIFGTSFTSFKRKWFELGPVKTGRGGKGEYQEVIGLRADMADAFAEAFYSIAFRVEADDVLDLPPKQSVTRAALLPPPALKRYRELRDDLYTELESGEEVSAANVLVKLLRLQQLCGGTMTTDSGEQVDVHDAKQKLLADVLSDFDLREPVVVFARFHSDLDRIIEVCREQGRRYGEISGRTKNGLTNESKMNPNVDVVGVQMQAGSAGIDLTRARYGVYYSMGYSLVDYEQSWRRLLRPGQERPVLFVHLTMAGTTDEEVYDSLAENRSAIAAVLSTVVGIDSERAAAIAATIDSQSSDVESLLGNAR